MNKIFGIIAAGVVIVGLLAMVVLTQSSLFGGKDVNGIGKTLNITISEGSDGSYSVLDTPKFELWDESEREKMKKHMKDNGYKIQPGTYEIKQGTKYEKALGIFKLEK